MATSDRAFNQVREILQKLDRSIDEARSRRLGEKPSLAESESPSSAANGSAGPESGAGGAASRSASPYGRATPRLSNARST